uniref:HAD family hydrolase n=1 Tax=Ndongobacter massiliensis TaxID=1871025 RepID=UPI000930CBCB|nr:HAD family hydrolase [Ndongobacter massiliensis]
MIRLFCSDFDNTLAYRGQVPPVNTKAVRALQDAGVDFALVSGRMYANAREKMREYDMDGAVIAANGAYVTDGDGTVIQADAFPDEALQALTQLCDERHWLYWIYTEDMCFLPTLTLRFPGSWLLAKMIGKKMGAPLVKMHSVEEFLTRHAAYKVNVFPPKRKLEAAGELLRAGTAWSVTGSTTRFFELSPRGVNKWTGVCALAKAKGIAAEQIAAIGDFDNDEPMLRGAKRSFATQNANARIQRIVGEMVGWAQEGGAAEAMRRVLAANQRNEEMNE